MEHLLALIAVVICTIILMNAILNLSKGNNQSIFFVYIVFYVFFVIPIILDYILGIPSNDKYPNIKIANQDTNTTIIYYLYIIFITMFWWVFGKKKRKVTLNYNLLLEGQLILKIRPLLYFVMIIPIILILIAPDPTVYLVYAPSAKGLLIQEEVREYHTLLLFFSRISIIAIGIILLISSKRNFLKTIAFCLPFLILISWVYGKRSIVAAILVIVLYALWTKGILRGFKLIVFGLSFIILLITFSFLYQENVRYDQFQINTTDKVYENFRTDYGRDDVTKYTIYSELYRDKQILEHRGQSFLYYLTAYIPRSWWAQKPYPYAVYYTTSVFDLPPTPMGWGLTTSILEESISNFSWLGILIGPLIIVLMCRLGDGKQDTLTSLLTLYCTILILVQHLAAFYGIFIIWVLIIIFKRKSKMENLEKYS